MHYCLCTKFPYTNVSADTMERKDLHHRGKMILSSLIRDTGQGTSLPLSHADFNTVLSGSFPCLPTTYELVTHVAIEIEVGVWWASKY